MSTDLQEREHTIQGQLEALRKYAQDRGYQIVAEYLDDGYSGATLDRPPFGYRWIRRNEVRRAHLEIDEYQAAVVRRMFQLLVDDSLSTWAVARLLTEEGVPTAKGAVQWQPPWRSTES